MPSEAPNLRELASAVVWAIVGLVEARRRPAYRHDRAAMQAATEATEAVLAFARALYALSRAR